MHWRDHAPPRFHAKYQGEEITVEIEVDLEDELDGEVFGPLENPEEFRKFRVDPEFDTIVWSNGADLAPEFLLRRLKSEAEKQT